MISFYTLNLLFFPIKLINFIRRRVEKGEKLNSFVISVGNLNSGGVGKTPLIVSLAEKLKEHGKTAILLRGYKGKLEKKGGEVLEINPELYGDEASMIKRRLKGVDVFVGKERVKNVKNSHYSFILLDDGFQYFKIKKNIEIIVFDYSKGNFLSRDFLSELKWGDVLVYKGKIPVKIFSKLKLWNVKIIKYTTYIDGVYSRDDTRIYPYDMEFVAVSSIGNNENFKLTLKKLGIKHVEFYAFEDHHNYSEKDIKKIKRHNLPVITTEKDFVKLSEMIEDLFYVKISIYVSELFDFIEEKVTIK